MRWSRMPRLFSSRTTVTINGEEAELSEKGKEHLDKAFGSVDKAMGHVDDAFDEVHKAVGSLQGELKRRDELAKTFEQLARMAQLVRVLAVRTPDEDVLKRIDKLAGDIQELATKEAEKRRR